MLTRLIRGISKFFKSTERAEGPAVAWFRSSPEPIYTQLLQQWGNPFAVSRVAQRDIKYYATDDPAYEFKAETLINDALLHWRVSELALMAFWNDAPAETLPGSVV